MSIDPVYNLDTNAIGRDCRAPDMPRCDALRFEEMPDLVNGR